MKDKFYCNNCEKDVSLVNGICTSCGTNWDYEKEDLKENGSFDKSNNSNNDNIKRNNDKENRLSATDISTMVGIFIIFLVDIMVFPSMKLEGDEGLITVIGVSVIIGILVIPICRGIGKTIDFNKNFKEKLPQLYEQLESQGISTEDKYISKYGNGVVIDRNSKKVAIIILHSDKPFIIPFEFIKNCELIEDITERIDAPGSAVIGTLTNNKRLTEYGKYDDRNVQKIYQQLGVSIVCEFEGMVRRFDIPLIEPPKFTWVAENEKRLAVEIVDNINSSTEYYKTIYNATKNSGNKERINDDMISNESNNDIYELGIVEKQNILSNIEHFQESLKDDNHGLESLVGPKINLIKELYIKDDFRRADYDTLMKTLTEVTTLISTFQGIINKITKIREKLTDEEIDLLTSNENLKMYTGSEEEVRKMFSMIFDASNDLPNCKFTDEKVIKGIVEPMKKIMSKDKLNNEDLALLYNYDVEFYDVTDWAAEQIEIITNKMRGFNEKLVCDVADKYLYLYSYEISTNDRNIALNTLDDAKKLLETKVTKDSKEYTEAFQILNKIDEILGDEEISRKDYLKVYNYFVDFYNITDK